MRYLKKLLVYVVAFVAMIAFFVLDVSLATLIPKEKILGSEASAYETLARESYYPSPFFDNGHGVALYDNSTEAIIFNIIFNQKGQHPFKEGILNWWSGTDSTETLNCLAEAFAGTTEGWNYNNYWLGIILPIKFLMQWFSYGQIRYIFYMVTMALATVMFINVYKKLGKKEVIAYLCTFFMFCIPNNIANLTAAGDILLAIIFSTIFVKLYQYGSKNEFRFLMFMIFGGFACFIDFLYAPMFPFGVMLVLSVMLDYRNGDNILTQLKHLGLEILTYGIGYGLTAYSKSILVRIADKDYVGGAKVGYWTDGTMAERFKAILPPFDNLINRGTFLVGVLFVVVIIATVITKKTKLQISCKTLGQAGFSVLVGAFTPIIYFMVFVRATEHRYYVQNIFPIIFALCYGLLLLIKSNKGDEFGK